jgi:hypothetical protein
MCMSCGCGDPDSDHGNPDNITRERMERAARAANIDIEQAADNIHDSARQLTGKTGSGATTGSPPGQGMTQAGALGSSGGTLGSSATTGDAGTRQDRGIRS